MRIESAVSHDVSKKRAKQTQTDPQHQHRLVEDSYRCYNSRPPIRKNRFCGCPMGRHRHRYVMPTWIATELCQSPKTTTLASTNADSEQCIPRRQDGDQTYVRATADNMVDSITRYKEQQDSVGFWWKKDRLAAGSGRFAR